MKSVRIFVSSSQVTRLGCAAMGVLFVGGAFTGCTQQVRDSDSLPSRGVVVPTPDKSVFLRASFDDDPSSFVGRFLPNTLAPKDIDENQGVDTRCSDLITYKEVNASGTYDEYYNSATSAGASIGVPGVASVGGGGGQTTTVRVQYELKKKMRAEINDKAAFEQCCQAASCPDFIIGEFFYGTGKVFQAVGASSQFSGDGATPDVLGDVDFKDEVAWKRSSNFTDVYFAFRKQRVGLGAATASGDPNDCSWANSIPTDLDGKYFVGISQPSASESDARNLALRDARVQAIRYLGEYISSATKTKSSALEGVLEDENVVTSAAEGVANRVKDRKWCPAEKSATPEGTKYIVKVLTYFPNSEQKAAAKDTASNLLVSLKKSGKLTPKMARELKSVAEEK